MAEIIGHLSLEATFALSWHICRTIVRFDVKLKLNTDCGHSNLLFPHRLHGCSCLPLDDEETGALKKDAITSQGQFGIKCSLTICLGALPCGVELELDR